MSPQTDRPGLSRREVLTAGAAGAALLVSGCAHSEPGPEAAGPPRRPNLVFVFSDQQSRDMLGCYGNEDIKTPNLDRFAARAVRFQHCVSSCPVCTPCRGMLISGQHPLYNGALHNDYPLLAHNGQYFGNALQAAGYQTAYIGKWHLLGGDRNRPVPPGPMRYGFDQVFLTDNCHVDYRPGHGYYWNDKGEKVIFQEWEPYAQTRQAEQFLDTCSGERPFALFVSWHPPHDVGHQAGTLFYRYDTEPDLMGMYDPAKIRLRPSVIDNPHVRRAYHGYYAMCSGVDIAFGRLMEKLRQRGLDDNTIIVFTSDHGDNLASYGFTLAKDHPEDTSSRVPLLIHLPHAAQGGRSSNLLVGTLDLMPTLLGLMGMPVPLTCQGKNLAREILARNDDAVESVPMFFIAGSSWRGVRTRDITYARGDVGNFTLNAQGKPQLGLAPLYALYDRRKDPDQLNNLFHDPAHKSLKDQMELMTLQWMEHFGDTGPSAAQIAALYRYRNGQAPEDTQEPGFRGRPIDLLHGHRM